LYAPAPSSPTRAAREWLNLTQAEVADVVGFSSNYIGAIETGGDASVAVVLRVSAHLGNLEVALGLIRARRRRGSCCGSRRPSRPTRAGDRG
jgi:DNA-binding XRE family transcriptional regulator